MTTAVAAMIFGKNLSDGNVYGFEWTKKRQTLKGATGSCVIRHSTNATMAPGVSCRIHLCAFNPCQADHGFGKYNFAVSSATPVEMHLQQVPTPDVLPAVAVPVEPRPPLPPPDAPPPDLVELPSAPSAEQPPPVESPSAPAAEPSLPVQIPSPEPPPSAELPPVAEPLTIGLPEVQLDDLFELPDVPILVW